MITQEKKRAKIYEFRVSNIRGIEVFEYKFVDGKPCVLYGKNGSAKSSIIDGVYLALGGKKALPNKVDNLVGPYSIGAVKKGSVDLKIKAEPGATELGELLWIHFGITEAGTVSLKITDEKTGKVHTTEPRKKVEKLLGMFLDPVELRKTLNEPHGDQRLAEKVCEMAGLDLQPYVEREAKLFEEFQDENKELTRQLGVFESLDVPQDDWATEFIDPASISGEIESLNALIKRNEGRALNIASVYNQRDQVEKRSIELSDEVEAMETKSRELVESLNLKISSVNDMKSQLDDLREKNKPVEWEGTQNIEEKISQLTQELALLKQHEEKEREKTKEIDNAENDIRIEQERLDATAKEVSDKAKSLTEKKGQLHQINSQIESIDAGIDRVHAENKMESWTGEKDPTGKEFPSVYLKKKMDNVSARNKQFEDRQAYQKAEDGIKNVRESIESINKKRKENATEKSRAVASVKEKFPHPGITVDENTVWVDMDDRRGKRTINDLSEGEKLLICTHILIAGNTGILDVLIIRDGSSLDSDNRQVIYDIAAEYGYTVILETIETSENGALHIVDGRVESVNKPVLSEVQKIVAEDKAQKELENKKDDSGFNW
jgi:DNA repair exonuclease SbcCD ATPase subunit